MGNISSTRDYFVSEFASCCQELFPDENTFYDCLTFFVIFRLIRCYFVVENS